MPIRRINFYSVIGLSRKGILAKDKTNFKDTPMTALRKLEYEINFLNFNIYQLPLLPDIPL